MEERRGPSAGLFLPRRAMLFSAFLVVCGGSGSASGSGDGSGADVGGKAEATQRESLLPEMESILPGVGRQ